MGETELYKQFNDNGSVHRRLADTYPTEVDGH